MGMVDVLLANTVSRPELRFGLGIQLLFGRQRFDDRLDHQVAPQRGPAGDRDGQQPVDHLLGLFLGHLGGQLGHDPFRHAFEHAAVGVGDGHRHALADFGGGDRGAHPSGADDAHARDRLRRGLRPVEPAIGAVVLDETPHVLQRAVLRRLRRSAWGGAGQGEPVSSKRAENR